MDTAVVTGGAGFIGSHLCIRLLKEGFKVICIDNLITGNLKNIDKIREQKNFSFIEHDVTKYISINGKVDYILHFASPASPSDYLEFPIQTLKVGSLGTHNALGLAKDKNSRFLTWLISDCQRLAICSSGSFLPVFLSSSICR